MGNRVKLVVFFYIIISIIFFSWFAMEMFPDLKYRLNDGEKKYIMENNNDIIFVGDEGYPPFSFKSNNTNMGYEADIVNRLEEELGININYKQMNWNDAINSLESGKIDVITGMKITEARKENYLFTDPYLITTQAIISPKELGNISLNDFKDLKVIAQQNSITHDIAKTNNAKEIIVVKDPIEGMTVLVEGKGDVWLENNMTALYYLRLHNEDQFYNVNVLEETSGHYGMAISKEKPILVNIINKMIYRLNRKGAIEYLDNKWFGIVGYRPYKETSIWFYIIILCYMLITFGFLLYIWNKTLRYELIKRTKDLNNANSLLQDERKNMQNLLEGIATAFATAIDYRDVYTGDHSRRVAGISSSIAKEMGLCEREVFETYLSALVHDVGKVGIPDSILRKEGKLTEGEYNVIKEHPEIGARILDVIASYDSIKNAVCYHHERWDGQTNTRYPGYPGILKENNIPLTARIISVADAFDAMTTDRPYRKALDIEEAIDRINSEAGKQFDPEVVKSFLKVIKELEEKQVQ